MKIIFLLITALLMNLYAGAQNIGIGTETPQGKLHIKGSADTAQLIIEANIKQSVDHPLIFLRRSGGSELFRIHADNFSNLFIGYHAGQMSQSTDVITYNTFIGFSAGSLNTTGNYNTVVGANAFPRNTTGANNVAIGERSLFLNTDGNQNTAVGAQALGSNTTGDGNTSVGGAALSLNSNGAQNTALGSRALYSNRGGNYNTALGSTAEYNKISGVCNTAVGASAMENDQAGSFNTGVGFNALYNTTNSQYNTAVGNNAGANFNNGYNNVFLGANTDVNGAGYYNVIAIGQATVCTASSQVTIGNGATNSYRAYANWSNISDGRFKKNIQENVPGLAFITQLRPVTYNLNATDLNNFLHSGDNTLQPNVNTAGAKTGNSERTAAAIPDEKAKAAVTRALKQKEQVIQTGFVAQEVEATAKKMGFNFSGIDAPASDKDVYGLRYAEFVVPLVKGMQEQQAMIEKQQQEAASMKITIASLQQQITELKALIKK